MNRGQLVPDSTIVSVFLDRLDQPDARRGAILDGFPRTRVQAKALDDELAAAGRRVDKAIYIDLPPEDVVARMANRRICTANGHVYNLLSNPPQVEGVCDLDGSALVQRADDEEATVRNRLAEQLPPLDDVVDHYREAGILALGRRPADDRGRRPRRHSRLRRRTGGRRLTWSPASRAARSRRCVTPGGSSPRSSPSWRPS